MDAQLRLLDTTAETCDWRLDDTVRETGRRGIARAREALATALHDSHDTDDSHASRDGHPHAA